MYKLLSRLLMWNTPSVCGYLRKSNSFSETVPFGFSIIACIEQSNLCPINFCMKAIWLKRSQPSLLSVKPEYNHDITANKEGSHCWPELALGKPGIQDCHCVCQVSVCVWVYSGYIIHVCVCYGVDLSEGIFGSPAKQVYNTSKVKPTVGFA